MPQDTAEREHHNSLAQKAATDEGAFTELYHAYVGLIFAFVYRRVEHKETAEDITSDIFRKVFLHLGDYQPKKASFRTWIYRVATNAVIDHLRSQRNQMARTDVDIVEVEDFLASPETPQTIFLSDEQKKWVQKQVGALPPRYQKIVSLKYFDDFSNQEIAEILGEKPNNVGVILHRALAKLAEIMPSQT